MAKLKYTKNELKNQRNALGRFKRYLPTLQLKKTQLQMETRQLEIKLAANTKEISRIHEGLNAWIKLLSEPIDLKKYIWVERVKVNTGNIAGVNIPVIEEIALKQKDYDLRTTPIWLDDAVKVLARLQRLVIEHRNLQEQLHLLTEELRVTSQRVNLFEKVKIPEAQHNIRTIRVFLGNQETVDVARAKLAKKKAYQREAQA